MRMSVFTTWTLSLTSWINAVPPLSSICAIMYSMQLIFVWRNFHRRACFDKYVRVCPGQSWAPPCFGFTTHFLQGHSLRCLGNETAVLFRSPREADGKINRLVWPSRSVIQQPDDGSVSPFQKS
jgi:hypothetical protein